jgi:hypothetical protein
MRNGYATAAKDSDKYEHVAVAERTLGKPLPHKAVVHHIDNNKLNNDPSNLVVCLNQAYHLLLHARQRVMDAGGDPNIQKVCKVCRQVLAKDLFSFETSWDGRAAACRLCTNARRRGKGYGKWTEQRKLQQQIRRAAKEDRPHASHN